MGLIKDVTPLVEFARVLACYVIDIHVQHYVTGMGNGQVKYNSFTACHKNLQTLFLGVFFLLPLSLFKAKWEIFSGATIHCASFDRFSL